MSGPFTFAIVDADETEFNASHIREDLIVLDASFAQDEGDFAALSIEVENPRVGFLRPGAQLWAWFAWNPSWSPDDVDDAPSSVFEDYEPMCFGRLVGIPDDLTGETVKITYIARPADYDDAKSALADTLRVLPYFDGIWFAPEDRLNPDNVLESRSALWHVDPVTHEVTTSDVNTGEDGTITVTDADAFYDSVRISYSGAPVRRVDVTAAVSWDQIAAGEINILGNKQNHFFEVMPTYTGAGLIDAWPKPGQSIGGGWSVGVNSEARRWDGNGNDVWTYDNMLTVYDKGERGKQVVCPTWAFRQVVLDTTFPAHVFVIKKWSVAGRLSASYDVKRGKSETIAFSLQSDTQDLLTDAAGADVQALSFASSEVSNPVEIDSDGNIDTPLTSPAARQYFTTDRGNQSIQYLIMVARAKLAAAARCVEVTWEVPWAFAKAHGVSTRKNAVLQDPRLPGGMAGGKIKSYAYRVSGDSGEMVCAITIGCTIGKGGTVETVTGTPVYFEEGVFDKGLQRYEGEYVVPGPSDVAYQTISGLPCDDDGVDFATMAGVLLAGPTITNLAPVQEALIDGLIDTPKGIFVPSADEPSVIYDLVNSATTTLSFQLKPLNSGPFATSFPIDTTVLVLPKTIDLEAPSLEDSSS